MYVHNEHYYPLSEVVEDLWDQKKSEQFFVIQGKSRQEEELY
jgi:hypothetical protein